MSNENSISKQISKWIIKSMPPLFPSSPLYSLRAFPCLGPPLNCVVHVDIILHVWLCCLSNSSIISTCNVHPLHHMWINCTTSSITSSWILYDLTLDAFHDLSWLLQPSSSISLMRHDLHSNHISICSTMPLCESRLNQSTFTHKSGYLFILRIMGPSTLLFT